MTSEELIKAIREEKIRTGITDYELAKRSGLRESTLQRFNNPDWGQQIETLCKIAKALGLKITVEKS